jgi:hypothetical protein
MRSFGVRLLGALPIGALLVALPVSSTFAHGPSSSPRGPAAQAARFHGEQLTMDLAGLHMQYQLATGGHKGRLEQDLITAAMAREQHLMTLMESDPGEVLRLALPVKIRAHLPARVQQHIEQESDVEGTLEVLHEDNASGGRFLYHLDTDHGRFSLRFAGDAPDHLMTGSHVRVHGVQLNQTLAAGGTSTGSVQTLSTALPNTLGAQKTLVILVNFTDKATQPYTVDSARSVVFTTTSNFDMENSYGQTWLTGDVVGWYTIPMSYTVCDYNTLATYAKQAATAAGVNVSNYSRHVFAFPSTACTWWGLGSVGGSPSRAWVNGSFQLGVVAHEMGHNLGLYHSHNFDCGTAVLGTTCTASDYGDSLDMMGSSYTAHFNAFQKERLGWLNYGSSPPLATVTTSGSYTIYPYETNASNTKALKLVQSVNALTGTKTWYYLEYRQGIGFDGFVANNANVKGGVVVHLGTENSGNSSYLLDMTPETSSWSDPALLVSKSFYDPDAGVTITPTWADASGVGVKVDFPPSACVRGTPTVTMSPSQSQWRPAGTSVTFTASVTNNDNQGCAASTFALQGVVPAGWSNLLGIQSLTLGPGATTSTDLTVTSPASTLDGFYTVTVNANDAAQSGHADSASATYVVMSSSLDTSVFTDQPAYKRPATVRITTTVRANGTVVAGASVTVNVTKPNGSVTRQTVITDSAGRGVVQLSLKRREPIGTYQVVSKATVNGSLSAQATTTFSVR